MQTSWRSDHDKLTFIACLPSMPPIVPGKCDTSENMIGDVNLFLSPADEDDEGCIGELELMIAPVAFRRKGYGRAMILMFLHYIETNLEGILKEYKNGLGAGDSKMNLLMLRVKIGSQNQGSIGLFESIGFVKTGEGENYFGEVELILEGFLGTERTKREMERFGVEGYREVGYDSSE
jgi:RimJ/RimL family protein N-acetyltransferase